MRSTLASLTSRFIAGATRETRMADQGHAKPPTTHRNSRDKRLQRVIDAAGGEPKFVELLQAHPVTITRWLARADEIAKGMIADYPLGAGDGRTLQNPTMQSSSVRMNRWTDRSGSRPTGSQTNRLMVPKH